MLARSRALFIKEYNNKLFNWLAIFSLAMVVVGRFLVKFFLLEVAAWVMFAFLETYTRLFWSSESLYYNPAWHVIVSSWETVVYSPLLDLDRSGILPPFQLYAAHAWHLSIYCLLYYCDVSHVTLICCGSIYLHRWAFPICAVLLFLAFYWRCLGGRRGIARSLLPLYNGAYYRSSSRTRTD